MKVIVLSNYFNHHQKPLADAMYAILGDEYHFVETSDVPEFRKKLGYQKLSAPYVLQYKGNACAVIDHMIMEADAVIYGEAPLSIIKDRYNAGKLILRDDESRYKNPNRYIKWPVYTYKSLWLNKGYLLCASAYAPLDYFLSGMNPRRCFRWGYFTELKKYDIHSLMEQKKKNVSANGISILWAGRLISLKHPETIIYVAERLKEKGLNFNLCVIGGGELEYKIKGLVKKKCLDRVIHFCGVMSPAEVRSYMEKSDIFMFTSDRQEGWGAVLNESMNSGCAVVADGNIGSVPYLIENGVNGLVYKSKNWTDLCDKVEWLVRHPKEMNLMGRNAYETMATIWNAQTAARNLLGLCESLLQEKHTPVTDGPCSQAPLVMRTWRGRIKTL